MKRINHFSVNDIVKKRRVNNLLKKQDKFIKSKDNQTPSNQLNQIEINQDQVVFNTIQIANTGDIKSITQAMKVNLIRVIQTKCNISLNVSAVLPKLKIRKVKNVEIIEKIHLSRKQAFNQLGTRKIESVIDLSITNNQKSYFLLSGSLVYYKKRVQARQGLLIKNKNIFEEQESSTETVFLNFQHFQFEYPEFQKVKHISRLTGQGPVFENKANHEVIEKQTKNLISQKCLDFAKPNQHKNSQFVLAQDAIFIQIQSPEYELEYINTCGMDFNKMAQIIEGFSVFNPLGKKVRNYIQSFQFKQYKKDQSIYIAGDPVDKFYLIIKGQIVFQQQPVKSFANTATTTPNQSRKNSVIHTKYPIKTQTLSVGNYFGEEEIIFLNSERNLSAKCKSSKVQLLEIQKQKFQIMLGYSDFYESLKRSAHLRVHQRLSKLEKNKQIRSRFALTQQNQERSEPKINSTRINQKLNDSRLNGRKTVGSFQVTKGTSDKHFKLMHGNIIRQFSNQQEAKMTQDVHFSMLEANPDMYQNTLKKFKRFNMKSTQKQKPEVNWNLKRVWKILNLQSILRQETEVGSPQGRKFYDSHRRYMYQINQSKSLRPKTSSSTYRTKLQYIAYLQQFKSEN